LNLSRERLPGDSFTRRILSAAAMEDAMSILSTKERLTLLRLLKTLGNHAAETRQ
jgi:hypothetical protein